MTILENLRQFGIVATAKHRAVAVRLDVAGIVHPYIIEWSYLVKNHGRYMQFATIHRLQSHQGLIDRADAFVDNNDNRQLQCVGEVCVQAVFCQRRVKASSALDDQAVRRIVTFAGID